MTLANDFEFSDTAARTVSDFGNDGHWTHEPVQAPDAETLHGLSCPSARRCMAVGSMPRTNQAAAAQQWSGRDWAATAQPVVKSSWGVSELAAVSCVSAAYCIAVGSHQVSPSSDDFAVVLERWDGTAWHRMPRPGRGWVRSLVAVSCSGVGECMAVGDRADRYDRDGDLKTRPLILQLSGGQWRRLQAPVAPGIATTEMTGVSCATPTFCAAVGNYYADSSDSATAVAETWDGTAWTRHAVDLGPDTVAELFAVSCPSSGSCHAAGHRYLDRDQDGMLDLRWDGSGWDDDSPDDVAHAGAEADAIDCRTPTSCTAVGHLGDRAFAERLHQTSGAASNQS
jgi:hypothetical protein